MGRPSSYTPEIGIKICEGIISGQSVRTICDEEDFPSATTVFNWLATNKQFLEQYTQAREIQAEIMADEILDIADDSRNDFMERETERGTQVLCDYENINRSRLRIDARKWVAAKLLPKKYGDKVALTDPNGNTLRIEVVELEDTSSTQTNGAS